MKKILVLICMILLFPLSCYINDTDSSRVIFRFLPPAPPDVARLHIALYEKTSSGETLLLYRIADPNSFIDLEIPSGTGRIFTIWAEGFNGFAIYYGTTEPMDVGAGESIEVTLQMNKFDDSSAVPVFNINFNGSSVVQWNSIHGADKYELKNGNGGIIYFDSNNFYLTQNGDSFQLRAYSSLFNLFSDAAIMSW